MNLKITIDEPIEPQKPKYPYVGVYKNGEKTSCVIFTKPQTGVQLSDDHSEIGYSEIGEFSTAWAEEIFTPLPAGSKITIEVE